MKFIPNVENLCRRDNCAVHVFPGGAYLQTDGSIEVLSSSSVFASGGSASVLYTPGYAVIQASTGSTSARFNGFQVEMRTPSSHVYSTGGTLAFSGGSADESFVRVARSNLQVNSASARQVFVGQDSYSVDGGKGVDRFDFYGGSGPDFASFSGAKVTMPTRDGVDVFSGIEKSVVRGGGGADVVVGLNPSVVSIGFYSPEWIKSRTLKELVTMSIPGMASKPVFDFAISARDLVNQSISIGVNSSAWLAMTPEQRFITAAIDHSEAVICGGIAIMLKDICAAFGVQSRTVHLWQVGLQNSHVANEVFDGVSWIGMDATYNMMLRPASDPAGVIDYVRAKAFGWTLDFNGLAFRWRMNALTYPISYSEYFGHVLYTPLRPQN